MPICIRYSNNICLKLLCGEDRHRSVGIAVRYGLHRPGKEFRTRQDRPWGPPTLPHKRYRVYFPTVKQSRRGVDYPPTSTAEVKERVQLHLYTPPPWDFMDCSRVTFTFLPLLSRNNELCTLYDDPDVVTGIKTGRLRLAGTPL